jgi:hypothetical protein
MKSNYETLENHLVVVRLGKGHRRWSDEYLLRRPAAATRSSSKPSTTKLKK